ncbi:hypothetical protein LTR97_000480 [Elasticomyces elasticus]|uniref:DUF3074 domain-containing protein n=1 Tax=Elasticomyces elasticus TaxID=574655 RepID=A0AAN7WR80_9PEZI|nr:hypothetical protein LTR97_000480 [Elasticomyces elasticus]
MADVLHDALKTLNPIPWAEVPLDSLPDYLTSCFAAGELIVNSVPPPANGEPFHAASPHHARPNAAKSAKDMHISLARPSPAHESHEALQKHWGKPYKFSTNPHGVALYKMAGHDRHGAWFARRSVHEGIGFSKFRKAMLREFPQTLTVQGGPGAGAIRGLAADSRLEDIDVEGVGRLEVYQLSGQMPKPVTPREFVQLLMNCPDTMTDKSASHIEGEDGRHVPRSYMIVSKPTQHPKGSDRSGFVRGQYESVEMIREIPLHRRKAARSTPNLLDGQVKDETTGRHRGATVGAVDSKVAEDEGDDAELNPVEWIMVTRSDPGGGIPRFLVDRGTPDAMMGDIGKFLDWAASQDDSTQPIPKPDDAPVTTEKDVVARNDLSNSQGDSVADSSTLPAAPAEAPDQGGIVTSVTQAVGSGITAYAPTAVTNQLHDYLHPTHAPTTSQQETAQVSDDDDDSDTDSSSDGSFMSAAEMRRFSTAQGSSRGADGENSSIRSATSSMESDRKHLNSGEKEVQKLMQQREKLDRKLAKKREEEEQKLKKSAEKDRSEEDKQRERHEKEIQKAEERHKREIEKLEHKKVRSTKKAEEKRRKKDDSLKLGLVSRERDESRSQLDLVKRENRLLLERMEDLQRENTALAARLGKLSPALLEEVQGQGGRSRAGSAKSEYKEKKSLESLAGKVA